MILGSADIIEHTETLFRVPDGQHKGEPLLIKDVPWFEKPLLKIDDDRVKVVTVYKATGGGGTTIGEIGCSRRAIKRPSNILWNVHIKDKVHEAAGRLFVDQFDQIPQLVGRYRDNRYDKELVAERRFSFPSATVRVQAANKSNAQSTRADCIFNDELWKWTPGIYYEMVQRTTGDFPYSKVVNLTSASEEPGQDADVAFLEGDQDEYHLMCQKCGHLILPTLGRESRKRYNGFHIIQWDKLGTPEDQASTVRMICPFCDHVWKNSPKNRRDLLDGSEYVRGNPDNSIEVYSCRFNSLIPWFEPWERTVLKWIKANERAKYGSLEALRDVYIKSLALTFDGRSSANEDPVFVSECYSLQPVHSPIADGDIWIAPEDDFEEYERYMAVDYQRRGEFWIWVIQADRSGHMRLIWAGRFDWDAKTESGWLKLARLREFFEVVPSRLGIDAGTDANVADIYENCAIYGYTALNAMNKSFFLTEEFENSETGEIDEIQVRYPFSGETNVGTYYRDDEEDNPLHCRLILWDKNWISELFDRIRVGKSYVQLKLPENLNKLDDEWRKPEKILRQLSSMVYADPRQLKGRPALKPKKVWTKRNSNAEEHLWDCGSMVLVLMSIDGFFEEVIQSKNEGSEIPSSDE